MIDADTFKSILDAVTFREHSLLSGFSIEHGRLGDGFFLQVVYEGKHEITQERVIRRGRKFYLSRHSVKSEVVNTAFLAILTFIEHEAREAFLWRGLDICSPHFNVEMLHKLRSADGALETRKGA